MPECQKEIILSKIWGEIFKISNLFKFNYIQETNRL